MGKKKEVWVKNRCTNDNWQSGTWSLLSMLDLKIERIR